MIIPRNHTRIGKETWQNKVLIVDDDISICKLLEKVMHSNELDTEVAGSGKEALELLKHHTYDVVLMDIMLGDMEGFEVIKRLRNQGISTPVMIVSGRMKTMILCTGFHLERMIISPSRSDRLYLVPK